MSSAFGSPATAPAEEAAVFWMRKIRWQQWRVNAAWWIETFLPAAFAATLALTILTLAGRRAGWPPEVFSLAGSLAAALALAGSFWRARRHFISGAQARAQLDYALSLHTRLTSAAEGIGAWPSARAWKAGLWRWNSRRLAIVPVACVALLCAAFFIHVPPRQKPFPLPTAKPPALSQVEDWLEKLARNPAIDPSSIEQEREEADQLARQAQRDWYSHASLEAADHLETQVEAGLHSLEQNSTKIADALGAAANPELSDAQANALGGELSTALSALQGNVPALSRELAGKLGQLDPSKLRTLSPEQLKELKKRLSESAGACRKCLGDKDGDEEEDADSEDETPGNPGIGGTNRGPAPASLTFNLSGAELGTKKTEAVQNDDLSHAALGDRVGVSAGQHDVDKHAVNRAPDGGAVTTEGAGSGAVWLQRNLTPREQQQVRQFFK